MSYLLRKQITKKARKDRNQIKRDMREQFHIQLAHHWRTVRPLSSVYQQMRFVLPEIRSDDPPTSWHLKRLPGLTVPFAPLVMTAAALKLVCELDIKLLSRDEPGSIVHHGDLDNRLKVLLDALRIPGSNEQSSLYTSTDNVCFCLLEDDHLISKLSIRTARLLRPPIGDESDAEVELDIAATIKASDLSWWPLRS